MSTRNKVHKQDKQQENEWQETPDVSMEQEKVATEDTQVTEEATPNAEETLQKQVDELTEQLATLNDKYLRQMAEFDNYRKRTMKEKAELILNGSEKSILSLLPVVDDMERAIQTMKNSSDVEAIKQGIDLIYNKFLSILSSQHGVQPIDAIGQTLNTDYHEAIAVVPTPDENAKGKIMDCTKTGYTMNDKVIRHAQVVVGE
ncbi:MAG: nucleotide exchange factor GrpE [Prevotellaceae bacterium]|jgi:molecular chaperone GrpE|nr:nucleotide exchange factor GrpE [Prevotellaceae bacterium]